MLSPNGLSYYFGGVFTVAVQKYIHFLNASLRPLLQQHTLTASVFCRKYLTIVTKHTNIYLIGRIRVCAGCAI